MEADHFSHCLSPTTACLQTSVCPFSWASPKTSDLLLMGLRVSGNVFQLTQTLSLTQLWGKLENNHCLECVSTTWNRELKRWFPLEVFRENAEDQYCIIRAICQKAMQRYLWGWVCVTPEKGQVRKSFKMDTWTPRLPVWIQKVCTLFENLSSSNG